MRALQTTFFSFLIFYEPQQHQNVEDRTIDESYTYMYTRQIHAYSLARD